MTDIPSTSMIERLLWMTFVRERSPPRSSSVHAAATLGCSVRRETILSYRSNFWPGSATVLPEQGTTNGTIEPENRGAWLTISRDVIRNASDGLCKILISS
jgi:hypothetical protein